MALSSLWNSVQEFYCLTPSPFPQWNTAMPLNWAVAWLRRSPPCWKGDCHLTCPCFYCTYVPTPLTKWVYNTFNIGLLREKNSSRKLPGLESLHSEVCLLLGYILTYHMVSAEKKHMARSDATRKKDSVQYTSNIADLNIKQEYMYPVNKEVLWLDWLLITLSAIQGASVLVTMVRGGKNWWLNLLRVSFWVKKNFASFWQDYC